uniref:Uncharacterized protein n=1 Tax=uncultured Rhodospirillales bacterium HF4000_24M03 TaxID=710788 RepID=E0XW28_9PROT|nr:hypothetical protein [uncultured Rhodospirillales bacterium HF4000_24M03]
MIARSPPCPSRAAVNPAPRTPHEPNIPDYRRNHARHQSRQSRLPFIDGLVVTARAPTPDPIPNSAVKTLRADGTAS